MTTLELGYEVGTEVKGSKVIEVQVSNLQLQEVLSERLHSYEVRCYYHC